MDAKKALEAARMLSEINRQRALRRQRKDRNSNSPAKTPAEVLAETCKEAQAIKEAAQVVKDAVDADVTGSIDATVNQ